MLTLFQYEPKYGLPNVSPFCMKVESFLRMANIQYAMQFLKDPRKAAKGKLPFIVHDGKTIADSAFILDYLTKAFDVTIDRDLTGYQLGISRMVTGALEERLYFAVVHNRWVDEDNWKEIKELWFPGLPPVVRNFLPSMIRKKVIKDLHSQGMGRHSPEEIAAIGIKDLQGLVDLLGDHKFLLGSQPATVDAIAFSFLANIIKPPLDSPMKDFATDQHVLVEYCDRMGRKLFPEYGIFQ